MRLRKAARAINARLPRPVFWVGFVVGIAAVVAVAVVALAAGGGSSDTASSRAESAPTVPAVAAMSVFGKDRLSSDVVPDKYADVVARLTPDSSVAEELNPGTTAPDRSRMLMNGLGGEKAALYAFPPLRDRHALSKLRGLMPGVCPVLAGRSQFLTS